MNITQLLGENLNNIYESFTPCPDNFILFRPSDKESENYSKWEMVFRLLRSLKFFKNAHIIQIGPEKCDLISGATDYRGTDFKKETFLLNRSSGVICFSGYEPFYFSGKIAAFYGFYRSENFGNPKINNFDFTSKYYRFYSDAQKEMDETNPLKVAKYISKQFGEHLKWEESICGDNFGTNSIDVIPDFPATEKLKRYSVNIRTDLIKDKDFLSTWLGNKKISLTCAKPVNLNFLSRIKPIIDSVCFTDSNAMSEEYIDSIKTIGMECQIVSSAESLASNKNKFFGTNVYSRSEVSAKLQTCEAIISKYFFSSGKFYISSGHAQKNIGGIAAESFTAEEFSKVKKISKEDLTLASLDLEYWYLLYD